MQVRACLERARAGQLRRPEMGRHNDAFPQRSTNSTIELVLWIAYNFFTIAASGGFARCRYFCGKICDTDWWVCRMFGHVHGALVLLCGFHCGIRLDMSVTCALILWLFQTAVEEPRHDRFHFHLIVHGLTFALA